MPPFSFAERVRTHPANARLLAWLGLSSEASVDVEPWVGSGYDQGSQALFLNYGAGLPVATRISISYHSVLVHPDTAVIYAALYGRFTFVVRRPPGTPPGRRVAETLDAEVRLDGLEDEWAFLDHEEEPEALEVAHEAAGRSVR